MSKKRILTIIEKTVSFFSDIIKNINDWQIDRDLENIEKMRIRDRFSEVKTTLKIQKLNNKRRINEAQAKIIRIKLGG